MVYLNLSDFATLVAYVGMAFLGVWWLVKSRTLVGLFWTVLGVGVIFAAERSDRTPAHLLGLVVCVLVVGLLLGASVALVRARGRRARVYRPTRRQRTERSVAKKQATRWAAQQERQAPEISASKPARSRSRKNRGGYIVNQPVAGRK